MWPVNIVTCSYECWDNFCPLVGLGGFGNQKKYIYIHKRTTYATQFNGVIRETARCSSFFVGNSCLSFRALSHQDDNYSTNQGACPLRRVTLLVTSFRIAAHATLGNSRRKALSCPSACPWLAGVTIIDVRVRVRHPLKPLLRESTANLLATFLVMDGDGCTITQTQDHRIIRRTCFCHATLEPLCGVFVQLHHAQKS